MLNVITGQWQRRLRDTTWSLHSYQYNAIHEHKNICIVIKWNKTTVTNTHLDHSNLSQQCLIFKKITLRSVLTWLFTSWQHGTHIITARRDRRSASRSLNGKLEKWSRLGPAAVSVVVVATEIDVCCGDCTSSTTSVCCKIIRVPFLHYFYRKFMLIAKYH